MTAIEHTCPTCQERFLTEVSALREQPDYPCPHCKSPVGERLIQIEDEWAILLCHLAKFKRETYSRGIEQFYS